MSDGPGILQRAAREDTWGEQVPANILRESRKIAIYHRRDPKTLGEILDDITRTVDDIDKEYRQLKNKETVQDSAPLGAG